MRSDIILKLKNTFHFIGLSAIPISAGLIYFLTNAHGDFVLFLNQGHQPILDYFFRYYTWFGSGFLVVGLILIFVLKKMWPLAILTAVIGIMQAVVAGFFKVLLFPQVPRPATFFAPNDLDFVEGVTTLFYRSFPSGHTLTAFSVAALLASLTDQKWMQLILMLAATLVAISRIYLGLHFLIDTVVGAVVGILITTISLLLYRKYYVKAKGIQL
ncbi:MAG: phosphatase PAP2 family protein [Cyclobacteriaceae bacterium]